MALGGPLWGVRNSAKPKSDSVESNQPTLLGPQGKKARTSGPAIHVGVTPMRFCDLSACAGTTRGQMGVGEVRHGPSLLAWSRVPGAPPGKEREDEERRPESRLGHAVLG